MKHRDGILFVVRPVRRREDNAVQGHHGIPREPDALHFLYDPEAPARGDRRTGLLFRHRDRFRDMVQAGDFAEYAEVHANLRDIEARPGNDMIREGVDVSSNIDTGCAPDQVPFHHGRLPCSSCPPRWRSSRSASGTVSRPEERSGNACGGRSTRSGITAL